MSSFVFHKMIFIDKLFDNFTNRRAYGEKI